APRGRGGAWTLPFIDGFLRVIERELLYVHVAALGESRWEVRLDDQPLIGEIFAHSGDALDSEIAAEVIVNLGGGAGLADLAEVIDDQTEELRRAAGDVLLSGEQRGLDGLRRLLCVEQIGVDDVEEFGIELDGLRQDLAVGDLACAQYLDSGERRGGVENPKGGVLQIAPGDPKLSRFVERRQCGRPRAQQLHLI